MKDMDQKSNKRGRPTKYRKEMCDQVIECGRQGMSRVEIAAELDIKYQTFLRWMDEKPEFCESVKEGQRLCQAWWERLGREGSAGIAQINPTTWIFNMKNRFKDDWKDKQEVEQNTKISVVEIPTEF